MDVVPYASAFKELVHGFRGALLGSESEWSRGAVGPLQHVLWCDEHRWRPDYLARSRVVLRRALEAYRTDGSTDGLHGGVDAPRIASAVGGYAGVTTFPSTAAAAVEAATGAVMSEDTARKRVSAWVARVAEDRHVAASLAEELDLWEPPPRELHMTTTARRPLWPLGDAAHWPPAPTPATERTWILAALAVRFEDDDRLPSPESDPDGFDAQALQILRRRVVDLHDAYLGNELATNEHFVHLRHTIARQWFREDLLDLRGVEALATAGAPAATASRRKVQRSQAAISAMLFYDALHSWDQRAMEIIVARRAAARLAYGEGEPLERFARRAIASARSVRSPLGAGVKNPHLPEYVVRAPAAARDIFDFATKVRQAVSIPTLREYVRLRRALDWDALDVRGRRTVLLADQSAHLDAVNAGDPRLLSDIDQLLRQSSIARVAYAAFVERDHAMSSGKADGFAGLTRSLAQAGEGVRLLDRIARAGEDTDPRAHLEATQQMDLALAGATVKLAEYMMREPSTAVDPDRATRRTAGSLRWSLATLGSLAQLEKEEALDDKRYDQGYLADRNWRVLPQVMRLRSLCAAYTLSHAHETADRGRTVTIEMIDMAYTRLVTTQEITAVHVPQVLQLALWHSFLTQGRLPLPTSGMSVVLRRQDYITDDVDPHGHPGAPHTYMDERRRKLITTWLLEKNWDTGAIERVAPQNPAWELLDRRSGGEYGRWRAWLAERASS